MTESLSQAVLEAADVSAVSQLVLRGMVSRDLGWWEQMRDCFHDDSEVRISWIKASGPEFVRRSKEMAERKAFRPTYRLLAYCLASGGFPVPNDLAGVDRPDLVDTLLLEIYGWAGLTPPR